MTLSSTMRTLIGGTEPSSILEIVELVTVAESAVLVAELASASRFAREWEPDFVVVSVPFRPFRGRIDGRCPCNEAVSPDGVGGVELVLFIGAASGAGGLGRGGGAGTPLGAWCGA